MSDIVIQLLRSDVDRNRMAIAARKQGLTLDWTESARKMSAVYDRLR